MAIYRGQQVAGSNPGNVPVYVPGTGIVGTAPVSQPRVTSEAEKAAFRAEWAHAIPMPLPTYRPTTGTGGEGAPVSHAMTPSVGGNSSIPAYGRPMGPMTPVTNVPQPQPEEPERYGGILNPATGTWIYPDDPDYDEVRKNKRPMGRGPMPAPNWIQERQRMQAEQRARAQYLSQMWQYERAINPAFKARSSIPQARPWQPSSVAARSVFPQTQVAPAYASQPSYGTTGGPANYNPATNPVMRKTGYGQLGAGAAAAPQPGFGQKRYGY